MPAEPIAKTAPPPKEPSQRGVALGLFAEDVSFSYLPLLREIAALGASHVALVVPLYQTDGSASELFLHTRLSPTLETVADTVRAARRLDLEVTLFPIVRLVHPRPGEWRGTLAPSDRDAWFASYGQLVGDLASLATLTGASRLVVASELSTLDADLPRWQHLIALIRAVYSEALVYSCNWDHYEESELFALVDEVGITGYFGLRDANAAADVPALAARWRQIERHIEPVLARWGKPFVFTELGYRSRAGSTTAPWDEAPGGDADVDEQQRGFEAFRLAWTAPATSHPPLAGSTSGIGTATAGPAPPATLPAASPPPPSSNESSSIRNRPSHHEPIRPASRAPAREVLHDGL